MIYLKTAVPEHDPGIFERLEFATARYTVYWVSTIRTGFLLSKKLNIDHVSVRKARVIIGMICIYYKVLLCI